jgi:DNA modification methylase
MINIGKVAMIPITSIEVGDRARQDLGDLESLEASMKQSGLAQPLTVKLLSNGKYKLLAGERRYTILLANQTAEVPVRIYEEDLTELEMKIIEKAENFYRKDFEYWEYDALVLEIHRLEQESHGIGGPGPGRAGHSVKDTADIFGVTSPAISVAIKRAETREAFPELFEKCKTAKDATNIIKKIDEALVKETIAQKIEREKESGSILSKLSNYYILGDFFEGVKKIPNEVIHLVEIDPPYAIDLVSQKKKDGDSKYQLSEYNEVDKNNYPTFIGNTLRECYRVMADHSWLILWFAPEPWFEVMYNIIISVGFGTTRMCGIWTKGAPAQNMNPAIRLSNSYEMFFYCWKGQPALNKAGRGNEFSYPPISPQNKTHPTERPIELMQEIYNTFAFPGSRVLIPFLGSGNGLIAAYNLGMTGVGFELSKSYRDSFLVKVHGMR